MLPESATGRVLRLTCSATVVSYNVDILRVISVVIYLDKRRMIKTLIRLCGCAVRSALLLFAYSKIRFSRA